MSGKGICLTIELYYTIFCYVFQEGKGRKMRGRGRNSDDGEESKEEKIEVEKLRG